MDAFPGPGMMLSTWVKCPVSGSAAQKPRDIVVQSQFGLGQLVGCAQSEAHLIHKA